MSGTGTMAGLDQSAGVDDESLGSGGSGRVNGRSKQPSLKLRRAVDLVDGIYTFASLPRIATGYPILDSVLGGGFIPSQVYVLPAGTGLGKTAFAACIAAHRAQTAPVVVWSLELPPELFVARVASQRLPYSWGQVLSGDADPSEVRDVLEPLQLHLHMGNLDDLGRTIAAVTDAEGEPPLVVLDYLQQLASGQPDPRIAVAEASEKLRKLAIDQQCALLVVSAVSRASATKARGATRASELVDVGRDTGSIEYDCAALLVLSDPDDGDERILSVAKNRFGRRARIRYQFDGASGTFEELGEADDSAAQDRTSQRRRQAIVSSLEAAGGPLSRNKARYRDGKRWVSGSKDVVNEEIEAMVRSGLLDENGGLVCLPKS